MTPDDAVATLSQVLLSRDTFTEGDVYDALEAAGVPAMASSLAFKFTQIACARVLIEDMGIGFSPRYFLLSGSGDIVEQGLLAEQPYYVAGLDAARRHAGAPGFLHLTLTSSEFQVVNDLLKSGSKPENLQTSPPALFLEHPTQEGMERARQHMAQTLTKTTER